MSSSDEIGEADRTHRGKPALSSEHHDLVDQLVELWRSHTGWDGILRLETGRKLNASLGPPTEKSPASRRVVRVLAEQLGVAVCDVGRMRRRAHQIDALVDSYSSVTDRLRPEEVFPRLLEIENE